MSAGREDRSPDRREGPAVSWPHPIMALLPISWRGKSCLAAGVLITLCAATAALRPPIRDLLRDCAVSRLVLVNDGGAVIPARLTAPRRPLAVAIAQRTELDNVRVFAAGMVRSTHARESPHATGLAYLVSGDRARALQRLRVAVAAAPADASAWSDLSAAELAGAEASDDLDAIFRAFASADRALQLDASLEEARFNYARSISAIGVRDLSVKLWEDYLACDGNSHWRVAAQRELRAAKWSLDEMTRWNEALAHLDDQSRDPLAIEKLVRTFPQNARSWAESIFLTDWAEARARGDIAASSPHLTRARRFGEALRQVSNETFLGESVAAIDDAIRTDDHRRITALVGGYLAYRRGRLAFRDQAYARAIEELKIARRHFVDAASPMAPVAAYYIATSTVGSGDGRGPLPEFRKLAASERRFHGHGAALAFILWSKSVCEATLGQWADSIASADEALRIFQRLGESGNAASIHLILAEDYAFLGQPARSRFHCVKAMRLSSIAGDRLRLLIELGSASGTEIRWEHWQIARAFAALELIFAGHTGPPPFITSSLARLAVSEYHLGNTTAAGEAIRRAEIVAARIEDDTLRMKLTGDVTALHGVMLRERDPRAAVTLLSESIGFHQQLARTFALPELYLERGRCYLAAGDQSSALNDFEQGIDALETQRLQVPDVNLRTGMLDDSHGLFTAAVDLSLRKGDVVLAFAYAERGRARALLDEIGGGDGRTSRGIASIESLCSELRQGSVLIEYVTLPDRLIIFTANAQGLVATSVAVTSKDLDAAVDDLREALTRHKPIADIRRLAAALDLITIRPVYDRLRGANDVIIVADRNLQRVPFAVLVDPASQTYFAERVALSSAPSASVFFETSQALLRRAPSRSPSIVVFADPAIDQKTFGGLRDLPTAATEGDAISRLYNSHAVWKREGATRRRFTAEATAGDILHFAGHALVNGADARRSAILLGGEDGALDAASIARIHFTTTRLVVLAACSTTAGPTETAEGPTSIARAFIVGGVPSVIGTLWEVDDWAAGRFSVDLHRQLTSGRPPAAALRSAQLAAIRSPDARLRHPSAWAAFELIGARGD
jgi:CHAT domain-containing protein